MTQANLFQAIQNDQCISSKTGEPSTDTARIRKVANEAVCAVAERERWVEPAQFEGMPVKGKLHTARMMNFAATGDLSNLDVLTAGMVCALMVNDEGTRAGFDSVHFAFSGIGKDDTKPFPRIGSQAIRKAFGKKGVSTARTQTCRTVGKRGLLTMLGATIPDAHGVTVANKAHPFVVAIARRLAAVSESDLCKKLGVDPITGDLTKVSE